IEVTPVVNSESSQIQSTPIEEIRIGERVAAKNPLLDEEARLAPEPNESWQWLSLHLDDGDGKQVNIQLLRPAYWVEQQDAYVGGFVFLELCELGAYGDAQVINIQPAPMIAAGEGRVVTGTFRHTSSAPLYDVLIEGESEPIGVTAHHPFWSEDRQDFIPTEELQVGERLLAREGDSRRVVSLLPRPGPEVVYNLEVHREHVYQVAEQGLLVHNCSGSSRTGYGAFGWGKAPGGLTVYDPAFVARQTLRGGRVHVDDLKRMVPGGIPDTFKPSSTIPGGSKFKYEVNGAKVEIKWHAPDAVAAKKFPGSRSGSMWTAQIKIGKKLLGSDGNLYSKPSDLTYFRTFRTC
ncbi:MAG: polymorphic toxin-type HINT domain-containing protein, partial [Pirellulales bacterium]